MDKILKKRILLLLLCITKNRIFKNKIRRQKEKINFLKELVDKTRKENEKIRITKNDLETEIYKYKNKILEISQEVY